MIPVTISANPDEQSGWHVGRLPSRYDSHIETAPIEWKALDKRLSYWLSPATANRRWYRRPGDSWFDSSAPEDVDPKLRELLNTRFGADLDSDRGDEIHLGSGRVVGLDGVDLVRIHDGDANNGLALIRFLLYLPGHMPDVDLEELDELRQVLRDFALYPAVAKSRSADYSSITDLDDIDFLLTEFDIDDSFADREDELGERAEFVEPTNDVTSESRSRADADERKYPARAVGLADVEFDKIPQEPSVETTSNQNDDVRMDVYNFYSALLEPVATIEPLDGTLPPCKLMTQIILGDDFVDEEEESRTEAIGVANRLQLLMFNLQDLDGRVTDIDDIASAAEVSYIPLPRDAASIAVGPAGLVVAHDGEGNFIRYRDVFLLNEMQGSLITAVDNALFEAGAVEEPKRVKELGKLLGHHPATNAFKQMHWSGVVSADGTLQKVYDHAVRTSRIEQRLVSTRAELSEANAAVARGAEDTMNWLLMVMAILAFSVPVGLTVAQFQEPWPDVWMVPSGLAIGALMAAAFWFAFSRLLKGR